VRAIRPREASLSIWETSEFDGPEVVAKRRRLVLIAVATGTLLLAAAVHGFWYVRNRPAPDLKERFTDLAPFVSFSDAGPEGWFARVPDDWSTRGDAAALDKLCAELNLRLRPTGMQSVTITDSEGIVWECRAKP
jgi:hypothetical protein